MKDEMPVPETLSEFKAALQQKFNAGRMEGMEEGAKRAGEAIETFCQRTGIYKPTFYHLADARRTLGTLEQAELYCWKFQVKKMNAFAAANKAAGLSR